MLIHLYLYIYICVYIYIFFFGINMFLLLDEVEAKGIFSWPPKKVLPIFFLKGTKSNKRRVWIRGFLFTICSII